MKKGADITLQNNSRETPIFQAARYGSLETVSLLIEKGAEINLRNDSGETPIFQAIQSGNLETVSLLIEKGAEINLRNNSGEKLIFQATQSGNLEIISLLIEKGVDINLRNNQGETPIFRAVQSKNLETVSLLIKKNAEINLPNNTGETPIFQAARSGNLEIFSLLIKKGADINLPTCIKNEFFQYIIRNFNENLVHLSIDTLLNQNLDTEKPKIICDKDEYSDYWDKNKLELQPIFEKGKIKVSLRDFLKNQDDIKSVKFYNNEELYKKLIEVKNKISSKWPDLFKRIELKIEEVSRKDKLHKKLESKGNVIPELLNPYLNHAARVNLVKALCSAISHPFTRDKPMDTPISDNDSSHINASQISDSSVVKVVAPYDSENYFPCSRVDCSPEVCIITRVLQY